MADTSVAITPGTGANVDARSQPGGDLRQVVTIGDGDATPIAPVDAAGLHVRPGKVTAAAAPARVAASATSVQLLAANAARVGASIYNDSTVDLYVKYGTAASGTSKKFKLTAGQYWEMPPGPVYTGVIHGIWVSATGAADVGEETI